MDRKETAKAEREFVKAEANAAADDTAPIGAASKGTIINMHDAGSGANETIDGLNRTEELTRQEAEETAPGPADVEEDADDAPVFDRAKETHL